MNFYGIEYLKSQSNLNDYLKYFFIFALLIGLVIVFSFYVRHQIQTKYRELSIIIFLSLLFVLGVQYSKYQLNQNQHSQSSQMVHFVEQVAQEKKVSPEKVYVNGTQLADGTIVKIDEVFYKMSLSTDQQSYTLQETYLLTPTIEIIK
ncbi:MULTISPECIES: DUF3290 domain-containing protein [Enterococcus]|uniref:DUF3290 domain-containing protein n=1 Tax=Enterococcus TaxID=1350 RepID=UPI000DEB9B41|nr:DUF3290 domain-containing protein [Enterococcus faecalis]EGO2850362.1 DUF3290 domain-containing protein [Enterococcus faecalis]EGO6135107.1 DUF3290 domain-containing protein [Enterococcus faecalis]EIW4236306.1 DUF3290 domain-containing protein [Enterococcus faecalis]EJC3734633.1 DUF3290 domain-containing protein [Enterococcus faecalis]EKG8792785.1 DUF3290 domain-containing protein [Enterococcus faecalis]